MIERKDTHKIIVHCSDTNGGTVDAIRKFHTDPPPNGRGWDDIGYHFVILEDGTVEVGRSENLEGSHCQGENHDSLGVCLIGKTEFTSAQFIALQSFLRGVLGKYGLNHEAVHCHYEYPSAIAQGKTCPNLNAGLLRAFVKGDKI